MSKYLSTFLVEHAARRFSISVSDLINIPLLCTVFFGCNYLLVINFSLCTTMAEQIDNKLVEAKKKDTTKENEGKKDDEQKKGTNEQPMEHGMVTHKPALYCCKCASHEPWIGELGTTRCAQNACAMHEHCGKSKATTSPNKTQKTYQYVCGQPMPEVNPTETETY